MSKEQVRANYNAAGIDIIEMMYTNDYLSIGGDASTRALAEAAGINSQSRVLDIGCGLGGPALFLAQNYQCHVTGLDLVDVNIDGAIKRASQRGLQDRTDWYVGDATALPFAEKSFNTVWGLDAWCHVDDKTRLIAECVRVTEPGGLIAFTDWLLKADMSPAQRTAVLEASASPGMAPAATYLQLFSDFGLELIEFTDVSSTFVDQYQQVINRLPKIKELISSRFSPKVYSIIVDKNTAILDGFVSGGIGGGRFVVRRPA
ncbi:MAG: methyltransferase domain-containing protein [Burkholderiaceae bacterium]